MGLVASVLSRWRASRRFSYGFGRVEVLSGFINALFLVVIAFFIFLEALERLYDPPHIHTEKLLFVSVAGLIVNLFGMFAFQGHGHSHGGGDHGHSHGGDSHGGGNANMEGVFLHVLADTLGSVAVIVSSLLIQQFGWLWVDPFCSLLLSILIFLSILPLLRNSVLTIVQRTPVELEDDWQQALDKILRLDGVLSYSRAHVWQLKSGAYVASVHVQTASEANAQRVTQQTLNLLRAAGATHAAAQVEADAFFQHISALCPNYEFAQRVSRKPLQEVLMVKSI